jgi:hypothetical protein
MNIRKLQMQKLITLAPWVQSYKTFYVRNSQMFIISLSVCSWQAFPALLGMPGSYPRVDHLKGDTLK